MNDPRAALYYAPEPTDPLTRLANSWLGRDPETGATLPQPDFPNLAEFTAEPRHYGFHATLRPPMRLAAPWSDFAAAAQRLAAATKPFDLPPLRVACLDGFLALLLTAPCPEIRALADDCVRATEPLRAPSLPEELARRRAAGLTPYQEEMLQLWGYPYVMESWQFHMTLTRRLTEPERARIQPLAESHFAPAGATPRRVESLCLFTERPGAPFLIAARHRLGETPPS